MADPRTDGRVVDGALPPAKKRAAELPLLLAAVGVVALCLASASLTVTGGLHTPVWLYTAVLGGGALGLHVALRVLAPYADPLLLPLATALNGLGLATIWALHTTSGTAGAGEGDRQLMWSVAGMTLCLAVLVLVRQARRLQMYPYLTALSALVLLLLPMIPGLGIEILGARRWVGVGPFTVQPSEFAKILLVVFLASYLGMKRDVLSLAARQIRLGRIKVFSVPRMRDLGPMAVGWGMAILLLVGTRDLGTSLLLFGLFLAMLYTATKRKSWIAIGLMAFMGGAYAAYLLFGHVQQRVAIWLDAFEPQVYDRPGGSHQVVEGMFALADGGILGTGFGDGRAQDIFASDSDLILVSLGEKLGLAGLMAVVLLLFLLAERGYRIGLASRDVFAKLMATGFGFLLAFQVFIVLGGATLLIPLTGMTTPFLAAGGSALMSSWIIIGLWLRMSDTARRPPDVPQGLAPDDPATEVIDLRPAEPPRGS